MSKIQVNDIVNHYDTGAPLFPKGILVDANNSTVAVAVTQSGSGHILNLYDGSTEVFSVIDGGNIGIGSTQPGALLTLPAASSNTPRFAIESSVDDNDFTITQYEDGNGTYTLLGQNVKLNAGGNNTILDSAHRCSAVQIDARNHGAISLLTGDGSSVGERVKVDKDGYVGISTSGQINAASYGLPNLLVGGLDPVIQICGTGAAANTSSAGLTFAVAGGSAGNYTKAGIFAQRQDSYNDLDMLFCFRGSNDAVGVTPSDEKIRIDSDGRLLVNTSTSRIVEDGVGNGPQGKIQIEATNSDAIMSIISAGTADVNRCGTINLGRHRNSTVGGTPTIVNDGDALGCIAFSGGDGTDMRCVGAKIHAEVNGDPGENDMPGALVFSTTPDGSSGPYQQEKLRITSNGSIGTKGLVPTDGTFAANSTIRSQNSNGNISYIGFTQYTGDTSVGSMFSYMGGDGRNTGYLNFSTNDDERVRIDSLGNTIYYGSTGATNGPGGVTCTKRAEVTGNGAMDLPIGGATSYVGHLYVMSVYTASATARTSRIYFVSGRYGNSEVVTQLQSDDGTSGGMSFTITSNSSGSGNYLRFTETSGNAVTVSMHFVGAVGL